MQRLALADQAQVESIYRESHALWGAGLTFRDYREMWDEISRTPWAVRNAAFHVWRDDDGPVLSSLKLYRPLVRIGGTNARCSVLGAIFTPVARRGKGHASAMLRAVIRESRRRGDRLCLLFSDIGRPFYRALGFRSLPAEEHWGNLPPRGGCAAPGWRVRALRTEDLPLVRQAHEASSLRRPLALVRDATHWDFLLARSDSFFRRLRDFRVRPRFLAAIRGERVCGYLISVEGQGEWNLREVGSIDGDPATLAAIFRTGARRARGRGLRRFYGWLPPELVPQLDDWSLHAQHRRRALPMVRLLDPTIDLDRLRDPQTAFVPYQDQF
jgi:predicted N-acetyltransferase YhbS